VQLGDVLAQVDGLNKRFVYYLEGQGYIQPTKLRKARISRRDYSEDDVARIRAVWEYYRRGYSVLGAQELVRQAHRLAAYVFLAIPSARWRETLDLVRELPRVQSACFVYGQSADLILRVAAPDEHEVLRTLNALFDTGAVGGVPRILKVDSDFRRDEPATEAMNGATNGRRNMQAYLLIKVPAKQAGGVLERLRDEPGVIEASIVYGETDIVARVAGRDQDELDDLILNRIQGLPTVESTRTFFIVGNMRWSRETAEVGPTA
jgi:DNA-binding Lrp family transcriptional regulator